MPHGDPEGADHLPPPDHAGAAALLDQLGVDGPFLLCVGTLEPRKNLRRLVEAYGRIRDALPGPGRWWWPAPRMGRVAAGPRDRAWSRPAASRTELSGAVRVGPAARLRPGGRGLRSATPRGDGIGHPGGGQHRCPSHRRARRSWSTRTTPRRSPPGSCTVAADGGWRSRSSAGVGPLEGSDEVLDRPAPPGRWETAAAGALSCRGGRAWACDGPSRCRSTSGDPGAAGRCGPVHPAAGRAPSGRPDRSTWCCAAAPATRPGGRPLAPAVDRAWAGPRARGRSGSPGSRCGCPGWWRPVWPSTTGRTTRCPERSRLPVVVTVHDCTYFDHPEWHERAKVPALPPGHPRGRPSGRPSSSAPARRPPRRFTECAGSAPGWSSRRTASTQAVPARRSRPTGRTPPSWLRSTPADRGAPARRLRGDPRAPQGGARPRGRLFDRWPNGTPRRCSCSPGGRGWGATRDAAVARPG